MDEAPVLSNGMYQTWNGRYTEPSPSFLSWARRHSSNLAAKAIAAVVLGVSALTLHSAAVAQDAGDGPRVAPAQNLEEVAPAPGLPPLTVTNTFGGVAHLFPTTNGAALRSQQTALTPPLLYHSGGSIMPTVVIYSIFWIPPHLQNGGATSLSAAYQSLMSRLASDYPAHGIDNNNTQYFQTIGTATTYIRNVGSNGGAYVDTAALPRSGCSDSATPGNCITDAQIHTEIQKVMGLKGWTGGLNHIFLLYTSSGEGSCFASNNTSCAYVQYCAYHSFISSSPPVIYGNIPYGNTTVCQLAGTPSPYNYPVADAAVSISSHEVSESITDPLLNALFTSDGSEIGDLCAYNYGNNTWDSGKANQAWSGHFYELQMEFDNHADALGSTGCVQVGPFGEPPG
jgi:hypothetical protein